MINFKAVPLIFLILFFWQCGVKKYSVALSFPKEMLPHVKVMYEEQCLKGAKLYELNCGNCHNFVVNRREYVPDFKEAQLKGYELRIINKKHEANLPDDRVTEEELAIIMNFLRYKVKNPDAINLSTKKQPVKKVANSQ